MKKIQTEYPIFHEFGSLEANKVTPFHNGLDIDMPPHTRSS